MHQGPRRVRQNRGSSQPPRFIDLGPQRDVHLGPQSKGGGVKDPSYALSSMNVCLPPLPTQISASRVYRRFLIRGFACACAGHPRRHLRPIHYGHSSSRRGDGGGGPRRVRLIPAGDPPHRGAPVASAIQRWRWRSSPSRTIAASRSTARDPARGPQLHRADAGRAAGGGSRAGSR